MVLFSPGAALLLRRRSRRGLGHSGVKAGNITGKVFIPPSPPGAGGESFIFSQLSATGQAGRQRASHAVTRAVRPFRAPPGAPFFFRFSFLFFVLIGKRFCWKERGRKVMRNEDESGKKKSYMNVTKKKHGEDRLD